MSDGGRHLRCTYEGASIEAANIAEALQKAKKWVSVEVADNSWLRYFLMVEAFAALSLGSV